MKKEFKMDFLCVGFNKSGTTTLEVGLKKNEEIYLPKQKKETLFFDWYQGCEEPIKELQEKYYPDFEKENKCIGGIEPSYIKKAKEVYEYFGKDVKIIFMMRNPVTASFSMFKMRLRRIPNERYYLLYKQCNNNIEKMFDKYIDDCIKKNKEKDFFYDKWIKEYLKYFPKEQMKFIIFEEFIKEPQKYIDEVCEFLGVNSTEYTKKDKKFNEGSKICKNYLCARINFICFRINMKYRSTKGNKESFWVKKIVPKINRYTLRECNEKMTREQEEKLLDVYKNTIDEIENITGRKLKNIWY